MITKLRKVRKMTYVIWAWCLLILTWAIAGGASGAHDNAKSCAHDAVLTTHDCLAASNTGTAIGVTLVLGLGFVGFCFLSLIWFMSRPRKVHVIIEQAPA